MDLLISSQTLYHCATAYIEVRTILHRLYLNRRILRSLPVIPWDMHFSIRLKHILKNRVLSQNSFIFKKEEFYRMFTVNLEIFTRFYFRELC